MVKLVCDPYQPNVYFITQLGFDRCKKIEGVNSRKVPENYELPNGDHVLHELSITETAVCLYEYVRRRSDTLGISKEERFGFHTDENFAHLIPDLSFLQEWNKHLPVRRLTWCALEMMAGQSSGTSIRETFHDYTEWYFSEEGHRFLSNAYGIEGKDNLPMRILCIAQNRKISKQDYDKEKLILAQTFFVPPEIQQFVMTTTNEALRQALDTGNINDAIWHRGEDLVKYRGEYHNLGSRSRYRKMDSYMDELDTYPLFPQDSQ